MPNHADSDFVIVGSGAGGGPLAANLALDGFSVCLIEAGGDVTNDHYEVPAFHPLATEDPEFSWEFFVKHYDNNPERDPKHHPRDPKHHPNDKDLGAGGIFYPRATGLGGCTAHHAMITVYPHQADWDQLAVLADDPTWSASNMRQYFDRIEDKKYQDRNVLLKTLNITQIFSSILDKFHAKAGAANGLRQPWLAVTQADPLLLTSDRQGVLSVVLNAFRVAKSRDLDLMAGLNPNHPASQDDEGVNVVPISVDKGKRCGARERILGAQAELERRREQGEQAGRLDVKLHHLATEVVFDAAEPTRAIGVRCATGRDLYAARHHTKAPGGPSGTVTILARKEVILAGGAFNTPQLLMLSGIGPAGVLKEHGIDVRIDLPGVGQNLQDRYEVGVVARAKERFKILEKATFKGGDRLADPAHGEWQDKKGGIYATNGAVLGIIKRSRKDAKSPDLYIFGVPGYFRGYEVGYSAESTAEEHKDKFTWAVLKGHNHNQGGYVTLRSADPFERPEIHFKYFEEGTPPDSDDIAGVVDGVELALDIHKRCGFEVLAPAPGEDRHQFVRDNAWGHHASCTCPIGPNPKGPGLQAVLDKDFRVHGARNLRVVDASVFPRIPGLFILASVYMISEKASDVIAKDHHGGD